MARVRGLALLLLTLVFSSTPWQQSQAKPMPRGFGAAVGYGLGGANELDQLGDVWYVDYGYGGARLGSHQRLYYVEARGAGDWEAALAVARQRRGEWWQFGNEPNDPNQDNMSPSEFARRYHEFYFGLARVDPGARIVVGGIADADWRWMDAFRESYRAAYGRHPYVDGWAIHNYLLDRCEDATDVEQFKARIVAFREWMARIGAANQPLLLTEYGVLYGSGCCSCPPIEPDQVVGFMRTTTRWLVQSNLVQGWVWFAVRSGGRFNGDLFTDRDELTVYGNAYRELYDGFHKAP